MKQRMLRIALLSVIGLGLAVLYVFASPPTDSVPVAAKKTSAPVAGSSVGGPFTLIDHNGKTVTERDFAGKHLMIYFGFTFCPAICPTELQKMTAALKRLGPAAEKIQPVFVTIDPERDTQAVMRDYVAQFDPRLVGLTGSKEQIDSALKAYRVFARKVQDSQITEYTMDHSSYIYLMNPDGILEGIYGIKSTPDEIVGDVQRLFGS